MRGPDGSIRPGRAPACPPWKAGWPPVDGASRRRVAWAGNNGMMERPGIPASFPAGAAAASGATWPPLRLPGACRAGGP